MAQGFVTIPPNEVALPPDFHQAIAVDADLGNSLVDGVYTMMSSPAVSGALARILGSDFVCLPGDGALGYRGDGNLLDQQFHKDLTLYAVRDHRPESVSLLYYPNAVTLELGPTAVVPGTHVLGVDRGTFPQSEERLDPALRPPQTAEGWRSLLRSWNGFAVSVAGLEADLPVPEREQRISAAVHMLGDTAIEYKLCVPAGSVVIHHEDLFHRRARGGAPEGSGAGCVAFRPMIKRAVYRGSEPNQLTAAAALQADNTVANGLLAHASHRALYAWTMGQGQEAVLPHQSTDELKATLHSTGEDKEQARVDAAYTLAAAGTTATLDVLFEAVESGEEAPARAATNGLASAGPSAVSRLLKLLWAGWAGSYGGAKRLPRKQRSATAAAYAIGHCIACLPPEQLGRVAVALVSACKAALSAIDQRMRQFVPAHRAKMAEIAAIGGPGGRGYDGAAYGSGAELDWDVTELRRTLCCASRSLGCVGQRAMAVDDAETAVLCCEQLLTFVTMAEEPGYLLPSLLQRTAVKENAAHALLRFAAHTNSGPCWVLPAAKEADDGQGFAFGGPGHGARIVALALERLQGSTADRGRAHVAVLDAMERSCLTTRSGVDLGS